MIVKLLTEHHLEFLSLKVGCKGSSKSTLVKLLEISCRGSYIIVVFLFFLCFFCVFFLLFFFFCCFFCCCFFSLAKL